MAELLIELIGLEAKQIVSKQRGLSHRRVGESREAAEVASIESQQEAQILQARDVDTTTKQALVNARRGQGLFRDRVAVTENRCRVTGVSNPIHLIASHIKPWRHSDNTERLDGNNGLLLTPSIDQLFDKGFISFADNGALLISPIADPDSLAMMGVLTDRPINVGSFTEEQRVYLAYHREEIFKKSAIEI